MTHTPLSPVVRHIRKLAGLSQPRDVSDAGLLELFLRRRDEDAFAAVVRRHGPLVWRVCRRVCGHVHTAEEAYQATFLVLAQRAAKIRKPEALASWLYGVAFRIARKARMDMGRKKPDTPRPIAAPTDPAHEAAWREMERIIAEEVHSLPEKYRSPILLCYWEGLTNEEAALRLGWPVGTIKTRLLKARGLLHQRLTRRGVSLSIGAIITLLASSAGDAVGPPIAIHTLVGVPAAVSALANEAVRGMAWINGKIVWALLLTAGGLAAGIAGFAYEKQMGRRLEKEPKEKGSAMLKEEKPRMRTDRYGDPLPAGALARLGSIRWRKPLFGIDALIAAANGKSLVTANSERGISIWDIATGKIIRQLPEGGSSLRDWLEKHRPFREGASLPNPLRGMMYPGGIRQGMAGAATLPPAPRATALSADGSTAAFATPDGTLHIMDVVSGKVRQRCAGRQAPIQEAVFSADGKILASRDMTSVRIWDVATGKIIRRWDDNVGEVWLGQYQPVHLALSPDGNTMARVGRDKGEPILVYDISTGKETHRLLQNPGGDRCILFSPKGDLLLALCSKGPAQLWDARTGRLLRVLPHKSNFHPPAAAFTRDGKTVAIAAQGDALHLYDVASGEAQWRVGYHMSSTDGDLLAFSADGKTLFASMVDAPGWVLHRYETPSGQRIFAPEESRGTIAALAFTSDDRSLYTVDGDNQLRNWRPNTAEMVRQTATSGFGIYDFSADGRLLAFEDRDGWIHLCQSDTSKELWRQRSPNRSAMALAFSPNADSVAIAEWGNAGRSHRIVFRGVADGKEQGQIDKLDQSAFGVLFNPDGRSLAWVTQHPTTQRYYIHIQDRGTGRKLREPLPRRANSLDPIAFSPDGRTLAYPSADWKSLDFWECAGWRKRLVLPPISQEPSPLAFSPDGLLFLMGDKDGAVRIFDAHTGRLLRRLQGHRAAVSRFAFSHDGRKLATVSHDTTALIWDIADLLRSARGAEIDITAAELQSLWTDLAATDAVKGYQAIGRLIRSGKQVIPWLRKQLPPVPAVDAARIKSLIAELEDDRFEIRERASKKLVSLGELATPALRKALEGKPALELRRRAEILLRQAEELSPMKLRISRSVEVIESIGGSEAEALLAKWAKGSPGAALSREAEASLRRLRTSASAKRR